MTEREEAPNKLIEWLSARFSNGAENSESSEFDRLLSNAAQEKIVDQDVIDIIYGAVQTSKLHARDVMVPRTKMACLNLGDTIDEILVQMTSKRHTRFPVIGDDQDDVRGILHTKDLLEALIQNPDRDDVDIRDMMRPVTFIPESKRLNYLFKEFRLTRRHMAIVIDEYSDVAGLITVEDVLETIVGDIEDEHDVDEEGVLITQLDDATFRIEATTPIKDFNEEFNANLPTKDFDSVGGIVVNRFGRLPSLKESVTIDNFEFVVISADSRRVNVLQMNRKSH